MQAVSKSRFRFFGRRTSGAPVAMPYRVTGLLADFDADDLIGVIGDAAKVPSWPDAAGDNDIAHATSGNQPTFTEASATFNGHASVTFAKASSQYLFASAGSLLTHFSGTDRPFTAFVVCRRSTKAISGEECVWSFGNSASATNGYFANLHFNGSSQQRQRLRIREDGATAETNDTSLSELIDLAPYVDVVSSTGNIATAYTVGASQNPRYDAAVSNAVAADYTAHGAFTHDRFALGGFHRSTVTLPADVEISRVLFYDRELPESERVTVAKYLFDRYCHVSPVAALPARFVGDVLHAWDANQLSASDGQLVNILPALAGGTSFLGDGGDSRPTLRIDASSGHKYLEFNGIDDAMTAGVAADWTFLHDGSDYSAFLVYRVPSTASALVPLVDTLDNAPATKNGLGIYHDAASAAHSLQVKIGAANATPVLDHDSQNYGARPDVWHVAHLTREGTVPTTEENYQIGLDNENYAAVDQGVAPAATAPAHPLTLGKLAGSATFGRMDFAALFILDRKLGRPSEIQYMSEALAKFWNASHTAVAGGNGLAGTLNDALPYRAFPQLCHDSQGTLHAIYRRGLNHGSSRGVGVHVASPDGFRWTDEEIIYDIDDAAGRDFRGEGGFICLQQGPHAGRLIFTSKWSADDSNIEVAGFPSTLIVAYSDDNGGTWTFLDPLAGDPITTEVTAQHPIANTGSPNGLIELQTGPFAGRILFTFGTKDKDEAEGDRDLRLSYSDDGGATWSNSTILLSHDSVAFRATESGLVEFADGELLLLLRDDTNKDIHSLHASAADPLTWTGLTNEFDGWGRPVILRDPNAVDGVSCFYRSAATDLPVWRYSADRGATWSAERPLTNLTATTTIAAYVAMSYCAASTDPAGNAWLAFAIDGSGDADVFVKRWVNAE